MNRDPEHDRFDLNGDSRGRGFRSQRTFELEEPMPTYVLMTKLSPEQTRKMKERAERGREWLERVKEKCPNVKFVSHYALLGPYDFLDVYEAPDEEEAAKVSMISLQYGALQAESWVAIPYGRFVEMTQEI